MQLKNIPMEFEQLGSTFDFQGAICFYPSSDGAAGVGHYTAVCKHDKDLVLFDDKRKSSDRHEILSWLEMSRVLVYASKAYSKSSVNHITQ